MNAARWQRMQTLFHAALEIPAEQREAYLIAECADEPSLVTDVLALIAEDAGGGSLLDRDLSDLAREALEGANPTPRTIGPYQVRGVLGEGGMGVVYLAERDDLRHRVAIKVLRDALLSPARRERFAREERLLAHLNHPSIARLYDAATLPDGTPYFVMEHVDGVQLTTYCETRQCSLAERLRLFHAVCEAVQYAHQQAVLHRDLKPSNILVTADGRVKLLDFGIAKQIETLDAPSANPTRTGLRLMTPAYAAPEQIRGDAVGVFTDVYALGLILYELLTGQPPFEPAGLTPGEMEVLILTREAERPSVRARRAGVVAPLPVRPSTDRPGWKDLDVLCLTAIQKEPHRRYSTVEAMLRDLDHYAREEPLEARPDTIGYRAGKFVRRNRGAVAVAALVSTAVIALVAFYTVRVSAARDAAVGEAAKSEQVSEYLIGLFEASDPFANPDSLEVRTLLRRGVQRVQELADRPVVQAEMLDVLGRVHTRLSQYDDAEPLLRRAVAIRRQGSDPLDLAESLVHLGQLQALAGESDSAEATLGEALAIRERELSPEHPGVAVILNDLGDIHTTGGDYPRAEESYRRALRIQRSAFREPHEELAHTLNNLAVNYFNQGDPASAEPYYREALAVYRTALGPGHPNVAMELANLGMVLEARADFAGALEMHTEALRIRRRTLGDDHYLTAFGLVQLGSLLRKTGDYDGAEGYLREAVGINDRLLGRRHLNTAAARFMLALTLSDAGKYTAAEQLFREVVTVFRETVGDGHYYTGSSLCNLAHVLELQGKGVEEAEALFREGMSILRAVLPPGHAALALNEGRFGALLARQRRFVEAEPLLLRSHTSLSAAGHPNASKVAGRLVELYEAQGQPVRADSFRQVAAAAPTMTAPNQ